MFNNWYKSVCKTLIDSKRLKELEDRFKLQKNDSNRVKLLFDNNDIKIPVITECYEKKSNEKSREYRQVGNKLYARKEFKEAIELYTKSICFAVSASEHIALAYANRSAVLFELDEYDLCRRDIELALEHNYPRKLLYKLWERLGKCYLKLDAYPDGITALKTSVTELKESELGKEKKAEKACLLLNLIQQYQNTTSVLSSQLNSRKNAAYSVLPPPLGNTNRIFPCATESLSLIQDKSQGRHAVAAKDIHAGEIIIIEKPFTSVCLPTSYKSHCYHCLTKFIIGYPCRSCASVRYCDKVCEENSWYVSHQYECCYLTILNQEGVGLAHLALKTVLKAGIEAMQQVEKCKEKPQSSSDIMGINENGIFDPFDYHCFYSLVGNSDLRDPSDLFRRALLGLYLMQILTQTGFFDHNNCGDIKLLVASHLLKQLQMLPCNAHEVSELELSGSDLASAQLKEIGSAAYSTLSLLNHSCDPSVVRHSYGDSCVLRSIKHIKKGDPIVDNYGFIYAVQEKQERQSHIKEQYLFNCSCIACVNNWPLYQDLDNTRPTLKCKNCDQRLTDENSICKHCNSQNDNITILIKLQEDFQTSMENVLDSGNTEYNLPILLNYLDLVTKEAVLPNINVNNCQEIVKLCFSMNGNFVKL